MTNNNVPIIETVKNSPSFAVHRTSGSFVTWRGFSSPPKLTSNSNPAKWYLTWWKGMFFGNSRFFMFYIYIPYFLWFAKLNCELTCSVCAGAVPITPGTMSCSVNFWCAIWFPTGAALCNTLVFDLLKNVSLVNYQSTVQLSITDTTKQLYASDSAKLNDCAPSTSHHCSTLCR